MTTNNVFIDCVRTWGLSNDWFGEGDEVVGDYTEETFQNNLREAMDTFEEMCAEGLYIEAIESVPIDNTDGFKARLRFRENGRAIFEPKYAYFERWEHSFEILYALVYLYYEDSDGFYLQTSLRALETYVLDSYDFCRHLDSFEAALKADGGVAGEKTMPVASVSLSPDGGDANVEESEDIICIDSDYAWLKGPTLAKKKENAEVLRKKMKQWREASPKKVRYKTECLLKLKAAYFDSGLLIKTKPTLEQFNKIFGDIFTIGKDTLYKWMT